MFFPRLRRHAKWMFVLLALVLRVRLRRLRRGRRRRRRRRHLPRQLDAPASQSVEDARKKTDRAAEGSGRVARFATALQTDGETQQAIAALEHGDRARAEGRQRLPRARRPALDAREPAPAGGAARAGDRRLPGAVAGVPRADRERRPTRAAGPDRDGVAGIAATEASQAYRRREHAGDLAVDAYKRLVALQPNDPNIQLELAQAAQQTGDATTAIAAYEKFLKLAPDDPSASVVRDQLKQLRKATAGSGG